MNTLKYQPAGAETALLLPSYEPQSDGLPHQVSGFGLDRVQEGSRVQEESAETLVDSARLDFLEAVMDPNELCDRFVAKENNEASIWQGFGVLMAEDPGVPLLLKHYGVIGDRGEDGNGGSERWRQLVEHTVVTAAGAYALSMDLVERGVAVNVPHVIQGSMAHDAAKRQDVVRARSLGLGYGMENNTALADTSLPSVMRSMGFAEEVITAAENTGRKDRIFNNAEDRMASIEHKGLVAAIVGYADARTIQARFRSLEEACAFYLDKKRDEQSQDFFKNHWIQYYRAVEEYVDNTVRRVDSNFDIQDLTDQRIVERISDPNLTSHVPILARHTDATMEHTITNVVKYPQNRAA